MSLYLKYRPAQIEDMVGNEEICQAVTEMMNDPDRPHSFLFTGPTGCGKTTFGRILRTGLDCSDDDFREVDSADFRGIDTVREMRRQSQYRPKNGPCVIWLIDECHKMTNDAQNALLKILEDTPKHIYFILATTDPQKLLPTIRGRCSTFVVKPLNDNQMMALLRRTVKAENASLQKAVYAQIIEDCQGLPRNALQTLDQVLRVEPEQRLETAKTAAEELSQSIELCRALIKGEGWKKVARILSGLQNQDAVGVQKHILKYCRSILLKGEHEQAAHVMEEMIEPFFYTGHDGLLFACYSIIKG